MMRDYDAIRNDIRLTDEIIAAALAEEDSEKYWDLVAVLEYRATREVFEAVRELTLSDDPKRRNFAVDVLSEFGIPERMFHEEVIALLVELLERETDEDVIESICVAFWHNSDAHVVEPLVRFKGHPSADIRQAVVFGLQTQADDLAVQTLIELSADVDDEVRNWATFGLGDMIDCDTPEIREALFNRVDDSFDAVRGEALKGLTKRHDERAVELLIRELELIAEVDEWWDYAFWAAENMPDTRLYAALIAARDSGIDDDTLDHAIALCRIPEPEEGDDKLSDAPTTCPVCGRRRAFKKTDDWQFCKRCGWVNDVDQCADPDLRDGWNRRSLNEERERWRIRLEAGRKLEDSESVRESHSD